jgi:hypothetical protein
MLNPFISSYVRIIKTDTSIRAVATQYIPQNTIIEVCPVFTITNKDSVTLTKSNPEFGKKLILNQEVIDNEMKVFTQLGEMELIKRLDSGELSNADYLEILRSKIDINSLSNLKSHNIPLGYGLIYGISDYPNMSREFNTTTKLCIFKSVLDISEGQTLTYFV